MPRKNTPQTETQIAWGSALESKQVIIDAAVRCFEQYGPQRTSMDDIAEAVGISRKTLYRVFDGRPKLIQAVLECRWGNNIEKIKQRIDKTTNFKEALLEGSITAISAAQEDKLANDIILKATDHTLEQFLIRGNKRTYKAIIDLWQAPIDAGRKEGIVKPNLSDARIIEIISNILTLLIMRADKEENTQREFLKDVLLPAITVTKEDS